MSINTEHQNPTQATATSTTSDPKGKCKEKEADPPTTEHVSDGEESGEDTWADYPFERFPSPPGDESRNARVPNAATSLTTPLDPPLMAFTYPPPPPLANDPTWYAQMVAEVHRHRTHVNTELELVRTEAAEALADATLAELELKAEREEMQNFLNRLASVAGKNFVRKLIRSVVEALEPGDDNLDDEEQQDADDEDSNASDEGEVDQQDAGDEHLRSGASENEEGPQDAEDEEYNRSDNASSRERSECPPADCSPDCPQQYLQESFSDGEANSCGMSECLPADESREPSSSLDWHHENYTDDEYSSGEDDTSRRWTEFSPVRRSRKRHLEVEEEEASISEDPPRKKIKETPPSPPKDLKLFPVPTRCFYPPEKKQDNDAIVPGHDSDEEYEVENSLTLEHEPILPRSYLPQLNRLERDPFRVRQNSRGEPELYVPGRLAIDLP